MHQIGHDLAGGAVQPALGHESLIVGSSYGGKNGNYGNDDHQFDKRKTSFLIARHPSSPEIHRRHCALDNILGQKILRLKTNTCQPLSMRECVIMFTLSFASSSESNQIFLMQFTVAAA